MRTLAIYYGLLQSIHALVLAIGLVNYIRSGTIGFPAPAPGPGWSEQAVFFLLGNGILDGLIIVPAIFFSFRAGLFSNWNLPLGLICTTASLCSGIFFVIGTALSGAWILAPINYWGLVILFSPVALLFLGLVRRIKSVT